MAIAFGTAGAAAASATSPLAVAYPTSIAAGDLLVLSAVTKFNPNGPTTPAGWTLQNQLSGGSGADGADVGTVLTSVYTKIADGTESGNLSLTLHASNNVTLARMFRYTKASTTTWSIAATTGADTTAGTSWSVTGAANPGITASDMVLATSGMNTDAYTYSVEAMSATGISAWGTMAERQDSGTTTGSDVALVMSEHPVTTGTATAAPVFTMTASGTATNNPAGSTVILRLREIDPPLTQAAFRLYEDGAETTSTAIAAQDTNITRDVTSASNFQLRVRLQNGAAVAGQSTDGYQLQYELNDSGTNYDVGFGAPILMDSHSESNGTNSLAMYNLVENSAGQSVLGNGGVLSSAKFYLSKTGSPPGNIFAKLYVATGTHGSDAKPTGAALATSDAVVATTLSTTLGLIEFTFTGANRVTLASATTYVIAVDYTNGSSTSSNRVNARTQIAGASHAGNASFFNSGNSGLWASGAQDLIFYIYTAVPVIQGYNSASLTDGNATTNRLGSGTGSFVAGEISEDGLVDDLQITASNYTELLYSLTLVSSALTNNDTLDFRVLRNGATTGMTYTVTPRITASKTSSANHNLLLLLGVG